jgi:uncharacterized protein YcfL
MRKVILLLLTLSLQGCASSWERPYNKSEQELAADKNACIAETLSVTKEPYAVIEGSKYFRNCMFSKGYSSPNKH